MGFFSKLKEGLTKTRKSLTEKIEKVIIGYADIDDDLLVLVLRKNRLTLLKI